MWPKSPEIVWLQTRLDLGAPPFRQAMSTKRPPVFIILSSSPRGQRILFSQSLWPKSQDWLWMFLSHMPFPGNGNGISSTQITWTESRGVLVPQGSWGAVTQQKGRRHAGEANSRHHIMSFVVLKRKVFCFWKCFVHVIQWTWWWFGEAMPWIEEGVHQDKETEECLVMR